MQVCTKDHINLQIRVELKYFGEEINYNFLVTHKWIFFFFCSLTCL